VCRFVFVGVGSVGEVVGVCVCVNACGCGWLGAVVHVGVCMYVVVGVGAEMCGCCVVVGVFVCALARAFVRAWVWVCSFVCKCGWLCADVNVGVCGWV